LSGTSDANIRFSDLRNLLLHLGFSERIKGSHHIYFKDGISDNINIQPKGSDAKSYQVKQIRDFINQHHLTLKKDENKYKYEMIIYWSQPDEAYIVEVPELPGCMADGETYQQAVANAEIIINEWIETALLRNMPIPEPKSRVKFA
jgi:predicted RNase H-like HicB family nuclease/predicted RNA binding protein YcfA (HicA-like mRNA interferase family)